MTCSRCLEASSINETNIFGRKNNKHPATVFVLFLLKLEEGGRGATATRPSSFREEQHPVLPPTVVVLLTKHSH